MIKNPLDNPLILRNYYQIKDADQVIAVGKMNKFGVLGGTKWAVQMGIDKQIPVFMFDQAGVQGETVARKWYQWHYPSESWQLTAKSGSTPPALTANTAGIGTRGLNPAGTRAVENLFEGFKDVKPNTEFKGTMVYDIKGTTNIKSKTTFDAIKAGERTMTTRRFGKGWENLKAGDVFPITSKTTGYKTYFR